MLTGENGILSQAQRAKSETENAAKNEATILDEYDDTLNNYINGVSIPEGLEIGSTVSYNPSGTYDWQSKYCSSPENTSYGKTLNSGDGQPFNINTWKVFDIDEITGEITLVPEHSTDDGNDGADKNSGTVYLNGAQGYNNGVNLLDDACSALYGNSSKGIKARSIDMDDIEGKMTDTALQQAHKYSEAQVPYGQQISNENAYTQNNSKYPIIYAQEKLNGVNGTLNSSGLEISDRTNNLIEPTANGATNGYLQATGLRPTQTYWYGDSSFMQNAFEIASNGTKYYDLLMMPDDTNNFYWVASRCVNTNSSTCNFHMCNMGSGSVWNWNMFNSDGGNGTNRFSGLFPVVSLSSKLISGNATDGFVVK